MIIPKTSRRYHQSELSRESLENKTARLYPFLARLIHYCLRKMCLSVLLKRICFFLNQMIFSGLILGLLFCHVNLLFLQHLVHPMLVFLLFLLLLYVTIKTSLIVLYVVALSVRVIVMLIELVNLYILFLVKSATNTSKSHKFTPSNSHSVDSSASSSRVVSHHNIHRKRKLRKSVISLFVCQKHWRQWYFEHIYCRQRQN